MDEYEKNVSKVVAALRAEDATLINSTLEQLNTLAVDELIAELCLWVEDVTKDKDLDRLIALATLPLPRNSKVLIEAVYRNDIRALHGYAGGDLIKLLSSLLAVIASLQEAGERL